MILLSSLQRRDCEISLQMFSGAFRKPMKAWFLLLFLQKLTREREKPSWLTDQCSMSFFYPYVQGGERTFNREVDICKYTWEKSTYWMKATASASPDSNHTREQNLSLLTAQPVLWEEVKRAAGRWSLWGCVGDAGALRVLEENHWKLPRLDGREMAAGFSETVFGCFGRGTWQQHLGWLDI